MKKVLLLLPLLFLWPISCFVQTEEDDHENNRVLCIDIIIGLTITTLVSCLCLLLLLILLFSTCLSLCLIYINIKKHYIRK